MSMPVRTSSLPSKSHSLKYLARLSSSFKSGSPLTKSSSFIQSGRGLAVLCALAWAKSESLGMSGYTMASESAKAFALCFLSIVFMAAVALRDASVRIIRLFVFIRKILLFWLLTLMTGMSLCSFLGRRRKRFSVLSSAREVETASLTLSLLALTLILKGLIAVVSLAPELVPDEFLAANLTSRALTSKDFL